MRTSTKRILTGATLGLAILTGCDPNPNGPTFPDMPKDAAGNTDAPGAKKGKGGPAALINDPAK